MSRYLNPGISFGLGGGRLIYGLPSMSIKIGALVLKGAIMPSTPYLSFAWQGQLNLFEIKKHKIWPNTKVYPTLSLGVSKFTAFNEMQAFRNYELLGGLNFEKKSSHLTWAFKVGANDLKREKFIEGYGYWGKFRGIVPFAEVALSVHVFKQRAKPVYLDSSGASIAYEQSEAKKFQDRNVTNRPLLSKYFNPRISLGLGSTHPVLVFPSVGVKIGRFDGGLGVGVDPFSNDLAITLSADIDAFKIKKDSKKFFTIGACAGIAGWNFLAATHVGVKKYYERSSFNWKAGVGFYESYPLPSVDLSYHYYLFKF